MATYNIPTGHIGAYEIAVSANTEDRVIFGGDAPSSYDLNTVEVVVISGTKPVYFRFGTGPATVKGSDCWFCAPGSGVQVSPPTSGDTTVRLICEAAAVVSVSSGA